MPGNTATCALPGMRVAAAVDGTLNAPQDEDKGWTAEIMIPLEELRAKSGVSFQEDWRVLAARYNYGIQLRSKQHASFPPLPQLNYHLFEFYAPVKMPPAGNNNTKEVRNESSREKH